MTKPSGKLLVFALVAVFAFAQTWADEHGVTKVTAVEGITEYRLDNGLRVLLFPDQSKQQITVNVTYLVGSLHEAYGETGMAHLLEHLVFKGTPDHPDISKELTERGAQANGSTWFDRTNYYETFAASEENLSWALGLESDRMVNSFIAKKDLDSEMTVVRNEWERGQNSPGRVLRERVHSVAFLWHNYGNTTIGARSDIENVPIERLQAFYRKYYQPDNAVLVVAGKFDENFALKEIQETFGAIPRPDRSGANFLFPNYTEEPPQDGERSVTLRRVGDVQLAMIAHHIPAGSSAEYPALDVLAHLLGTPPSGRLYTNLVEEKLASSTYAYAESFQQPALLITGAEVRKEDDLAAAETAILATFDELKTSPPTAEEVNRAIADYSARIDLSFTNPQRLALQLSEWAAMGDWRLLFLYRDNLQKVTKEDVLAAAEKYLIPSNRTTGYFYPVEHTPPRAEVPATPDVVALTENYQSNKVVQAGEAFDPSPANIDARTEVLELPSGIRVAFLPKQTRGSVVRVSIAFYHGTLETVTGKSNVASLTGSMLMRGTSERTRQQIIDELDRLKAQGGVGGGVTSSSASFNTVRESLPELLRLTGEILQQPAFSEQEFNVLKSERLAGLEASLSEPQPLAQIALMQHISPYPEGHPFAVTSFEDDIEAINNITLDDIKSFHETFYGTQAGYIVIVGDFDPAEITPILNDTFGTWPANGVRERIENQTFDVEPLRDIIETPDKTNAVMYAAQVIAMNQEDPDYPALRVGTYVLGGGFLNSRLATRIRQNDGLSYGVGGYLSAHPSDKRSILNAYAIFAPENSDKVLHAFEEEIARALEEGLTEEEVETAKTALLDGAKNSRADDASLTSQLASHLYWGRTMAFTAAQEAAIAALTAADVNAAMQRRLGLDKMSIVRAGDFANKQQSADAGE